MIKPKPKLSDMPTHIKQSIVDDSDIETKLSLREINKQFKEIVEKSAINYESLTLSLSFNKIELVWEKTQKETVKQSFKPIKKGYVVRKVSKTIRSGEGDFRKAAVAKMLSVFKNSKVTVEELIMEVDFFSPNQRYETQKFEADRAAIFEEIGRILSLNNFRLKLAKLNICFQVNEQMLLSVLQYLEPGILEVLDIKCRLPSWVSQAQPLTVCNQILNTEQWKQLKEAEIHAFKLDVPFEKCLHLEKLSLQFSRSPTKTMKAFLEIVLQTSTIKECWLHCPAPDVFDMTGAREYLDQLEKIPERSRYWQTCIKHPYEAGKQAVIEMNMFTLKIEKYDD